MSKKKTIQAGTFITKENWVIKTVNNETGNVLSYEEKNLIVNDGLTLLRNLLAGDAVANPQAIGIGTGTTSPVNADTTLETELTRALAIITKPASYQVKYSKTFTFGSGVSENITEAGLFDSDTVSGSIMLARTTFSAKPVSAVVDLIVQAIITISRV